MEVQIEPKTNRPSTNERKSSSVGTEMTSTPNSIDIDYSEFVKADKSTLVASKNRPSLSYWQDAMIRFKKNKQAVASLAMITFLTLFVTVGPMIWNVDPNGQSMTRVSEPPSLGSPAIVLDETKPYEEIKLADFPEAPTELVQNPPAPEGIELMEPASVQSVRLKWKPVQGAAAYFIYRSEVEPSAGALGVPIGETSSGNVVSFEDNLNVESRPYFYSIVAKDLDGNESTNYGVFPITIARSVTIEQAQHFQEGAKAGDTVMLEPAPMGTDALGRDVLARLMYGGKISLFIGTVAAFLYVFLGVIIGGIAGYFGGKTDVWIMRVTDFVTGLPFLLFMILLKVVLAVGPGESGTSALVVALVVLSWTGSARLVRGQILQIRESDYVHAAKLLGASSFHILARHVIPNLFGVILISLTFGIPGAIFAEAFLSFIGLGVASPATSWGSMCTEGIQTLLIHPHEFFFPSIFIAATVLAFNLLGDGLRDALDPKMRSTT